MEQALADTAHFIEYIKSNAVTPGAQNSPVIVIGGQYSASLAAWARQSKCDIANCFLITSLLLARLKIQEIISVFL